MYVLLCLLPCRPPPPVECGFVRALVVVSDRRRWWGGGGGGGDREVGWVRLGGGGWHILGSMPMRAAWSSKQSCVEPLNQSVSLTATTYNLMRACQSPVSLTVQDNS